MINTLNAQEVEATSDMLYRVGDVDIAMGAKAIPFLPCSNHNRFKNMDKAGQFRVIEADPDNLILVGSGVFQDMQGFFCWVVTLKAHDPLHLNAKIHPPYGTPLKQPFDDRLQGDSLAYTLLRIEHDLGVMMFSLWQRLRWP